MIGQVSLATLRPALPGVALYGYMVRAGLAEVPVGTAGSLHRAGELTAIYIPTADDEAMRDLVRAREDAVGSSTQAKHRLKAFLLRQERRYPGQAGWTKVYRRWLTDLSFPLEPQHIALQEYRDTIDETESRVERLTNQLRAHTPTWR